MTSRNDITGDNIKTKANSKRYKENWEKIFGKKDKKEDKERVDKE